jgi:Common central domain of tyrosinase/Polyphenol oxidase middle domain
MKKLFLLPAGVLIALLTLLSFAINNQKKYSVAKKPTELIECIPGGPYIINAVSFTPPVKPFAVMVRKNVYSLTVAEINSIKTGITNMKALPHTNPTSWLYQAAIHGTTLPDALPSWNTCHQAGASFFFLAWHRMYCYFFERILRDKSGDPNLTLPYWNYQTNAALHPDYRNSAASNSLYDGTRSVTINSGGSLPASIMTSITNALNDNIPYYDFQGDINGPHGSVHGSVGGNMGGVNSAAKDPMFWLHHCNIDRLWEEWLGKCGGRTNPTDAPWLTKSYTFFNETGAAISMTGSQIVNVATQLNYKYDDQKYCLKIIPWKWYIYKRWPLIKWPIPYFIDKQLLKRQFREAKPEMLDNFIKQRNKPRFNFTDKESPDKLIIEIENVKVEKAPEGAVEVYLNLPANEQPNPKSKSFVGLLDLFSVSHANAHPNMRGMASETKIELNASRTVKALGLSIADLKNAEISFFVRGNSMKGREVRTTANIRVEGVNLAIEEAQK